MLSLDSTQDDLDAKLSGYAEAVVLGTRVLVFSHRPAKIKKEVEIDYQRPRLTDDENLLPYQKKILAELRPEVKK